MYVEVTEKDFHFASFHLKVGKLRAISSKLQGFIEECEAAIGRKELLFCNLDDHPDYAQSDEQRENLACVRDYPFYKVVYLRMSQNPELIVAHELGHVCLTEGEEDSWGFADLGFSTEWLPPAVRRFISRMANLVSDVGANRRAHVRGFDMQPLLLYQLRSLVEGCQETDLEAMPSRLDITFRAAQLASTAVFQTFCSLTQQEHLCLKTVCDFYDRWHPAIRDLAKEIRDSILENGYEKRDGVVASIKAIIQQVTDALELKLGDGGGTTGQTFSVRYDPAAFCIPQEVIDGERANPYALTRPFLRPEVQREVGRAEHAQAQFVQAFFKGLEAEE